MNKKMKIKLDICLDSFENQDEYISFMKDNYDLEVILHDGDILSAEFIGEPDNVIRYLPAYGLLKSDLISDEFSDIKDAYLKAIGSINDQDYYDRINAI